MEVQKVIYSTDKNRYAIYERRFGSGYNRKCIDGKVTSCSNCVGYCQYNKHPGFLTTEHLMKHNCEGKGCDYYIAKPKREKIKRSGYVAEILEFIRSEVESNEGIRVINIKEQEGDKYVAYYVTITNDLPFEKAVQEVVAKFNVELEFIQLNYDFDTCVEIILRR